MKKIFIVHAWPEDDDKKSKQRTFIRQLKYELEQKNFKVIWDFEEYNKTSLNTFMRENLSNSDVIVPICDEFYLEKSLIHSSGVTYELELIVENNYLDKLIPIKIEECELPKIFGSIEYTSFFKEYSNQRINEDSVAMGDFYKRLATLLKDTELFPKDRIIEQVEREIDSLGIINGLINKNDLLLSDIYVYPELSIENEKEVKYISVDNYIKQENYLSRSIIVGDRQSGKSSLLRMLFLNLYNRELQPIILSKEDMVSQNIKKIINQKYISTYESSNKNSPENIIIMVDDFHRFSIPHQDLILKLEGYKGIILFADEIFDISFFKNIAFSRYVIQPMRPSIRNKLIENILANQGIDIIDENDRLKKLDEHSELINLSFGLGKGYKNGIIPAFPLYIIIIIGAASDNRNKLDSPISSHGLCYQMLIDLTFQNSTIKHDMIDSYINFLTYLSYYFFQKQKHEISKSEFDEFTEEYIKRFNIYDLRKYFNPLYKTGLIKKNSFGFTEFSYDYVYYFFLGKYFSEKFEEEYQSIENIVDGLDKEENGNICIFIAHHSKNIKFIELLISSLNTIFKNYSISTLNKQELKNLDKEVTFVLSNLNLQIGDYREERKKILESQDKAESKQMIDLSEKELNKKNDNSNFEESRQREIRKAIQTVDVIGAILKNRHGSIEKDYYDKLLMGAVNTNLRVLMSFIELITEENFVKELEEAIFKSIDFKDNDQSKGYFRKELKNMLLKLIFSTILGVITKTINSVGSEAVSHYFTNKINKENFVPSYVLIKRGMELKYEKQLYDKEILDEINNPQTSEIVKKILKLFVINYASTHQIDYKAKAKIEKQFGLPTNEILKREQRLKSIEN